MKGQPKSQAPHVASSTLSTPGGWRTSGGALNLKVEGSLPLGIACWGARAFTPQRVQRYRAFADLLSVIP